MNQKVNILLGIGNTAVFTDLLGNLENESFHIIKVGRPADLFSHLNGLSPLFDLIILDNSFITDNTEDEPRNLFELAQTLNDYHAELPVILCAPKELNNGDNAVPTTVYRFMPYPINKDDFLWTIRSGYEYRMAQHERRVIAQLLNTSAALSRKQSLEEILNIVLYSVQATGFDRVRLYLVSPDGRTFEGRAHVGMGASFVGFNMDVNSDPELKKLSVDSGWQITVRKGKKPLIHDKALDREDVDEWVYLPLVLHEEVIGLLVADNKHSQRPIPHNRLDTLSIFASQAASAIHNTRLAEQEKEASLLESQRIRNREAIRDVFTAILSTLSLDEILNKTCKAVVELFGVDHSGLVVFDDDQQTGTVVAEHPNIGAKGIEIPLKGIPAEEKLLATRNPLTLDIVEDKEALDAVGEILQKFDVRSLLIIPLIFKGKILGSFSLDTIGQTRTFSEDEIELGQIFASQAAVAIVNGQLFEQASQRAEQLDTLRRTTLALISEPDQSRILQKIVSGGVTLLNAKGGGIKIYDPKRGELEVIADYGHTHSAIGEVIKVGQGMAGTLIQSRQPYMIIEDYAQWPQRVQTFPLASELGAMLGVLLRWQDELLGVLYVNDNPGRRFTVQDAEMLQMFADHAAIAYHNTKLITALDNQRDLFARLVESSPNGVISNNQNGDITVFNKKASEILGFSNEEARGMPVKEIYAEKEEAAKIGMTIRKDQMLEDYETILLSKDGERIPIKLTATSFNDSAGKRSGYMGYFEDLRAIRETRGRLDLLLAATKLLAHADSLQEGLNRFAEMMVTFLNASFCRIFLIDSTERFLIPSAVYPLPGSKSEISWQPRLKELVPIAEWPRMQELLHEWDVNVIHHDGRQGREILQRLTRSLGLAKEIQALMVVPLRTRQNKVVGLLDLGQLRASARFAFSEEQQNLVVAVAKQTAVLIDRFNLHESTKQAEERLRLSYEASNALVSAEDPKQIWREMVEETCRVADANGVRMFLIDMETGQQTELFETGVSHLQTASEIRPAGLSMTIMKTGEPQTVEDATRDKRANPSFFRRGIVAAVGLPVSIGGVPIGVVWIYYDRPHRFTVSDVETLQLFINQAAIAYDNAHRITSQERMRQAAEALAAAEDLQELNKQIILRAQGVMKADSVAFWAYDDNRDTFILDNSVAAIPEVLWQKFQKQRPRSGGTAETVMKLEWIGVHDVDDSEQYPFLGESTKLLLNEIGVLSFQGIALRVGEEKLGVLYINFNRRRRFTEEDKEYGRIFATHAALALKKAKLLDRVQKAQRTAAIVAEVTTLTNNLSETLEEIVKGTYIALRCDAVVLYTYHERTERFVYPPTLCGVNYPERVKRLPALPEDSIVHQMLIQDRIYIVENIENDLLFKNRRFPEEEGIASCVAIPLLVGTERVGVMFVNYRRPHHFTSDELENIHMFGNQTAVAIHNIQQYDYKRKQASALEALHKAAQSVTASLDLEEILSRIVEQAWNLVSFEGRIANYASLWTLWLVEDHSKAKLVAAFPKDELGKTKETVGDEIDWRKGKNGRIGIMGRAITKGEPELVVDVTKDPDYLKSHEETRSELVVPIKWKNKVIGIITVQHPEVNAFDEDDKQALQSLAAQAAIAITNAKHYNQLDKRVKALQALDAAAHAVTNSLDLDETLFEIAKQASELTGHDGEKARFSHLALLKGDHLRFRTAHPPDNLEKLQQLIINIKDDKNRIGITGQAIKLERPVLVADVKGHEHYIEYHPETRSELAVPVKSDKRVIGVINVEHPKPNIFDEEDVQALQTLAKYAAIAIQHAQLYSWLETVARIGSEATISLSITPLLRTVCKWLEKDARASMTASIRLYDEKRNILVFDPSWHENLFDRIDIEGETGRTSQKLSQGICGYVASHKVAVNVGDVTALDAFPKALRLISATRSEMCVPILYGSEGELVGVLHVQSPEVNAFDESDQRFLETLANQLAVAIRKAMDYEDLQYTKGLVGASTALAWMGMASNTWRHSIEGDALSIRNNVNLLKGKLGYNEPELEEVGWLKERLNHIDQLADKILERPITPPLGSEDGAEYIVINDFLSERMGQLSQLEDFGAVEGPYLYLHDTRDVQVWTSSEWLRRALDLVVGNAIRAMKNRKVKKLTITTKKVETQLIILVKDTGPGIPPKIQQKLFKERIEGGSGMGMGLLMVQAILQAYQGEIWIERTGKAGTTIALSLPVTAKMAAV
jgi:PAS domain S-box-containing protein